MKKIIFIFMSLLFMTSAKAQEDKFVKEIKTYMPFTWPVDPARIITTPDMDLSYALAGTLVEWGKNKQIISGIAATWEIIEDKILRFKIRSNAKWSDGSLVKADEIKRSLERGIKTYPVDLRSLAAIIENISCPSNEIIDFKLKIDAKKSGLLEKLTEANYGILKINSNGDPDLTKTTGPFYISNQSKDKIVLKLNQSWHDFTKGMADLVEIRQPQNVEMDAQTILLEDKWSNLSQASSLISNELMQKYETNKFQIWKRPVDRIFLFHLGQRQYSSNGLQLFQFLAHKLNKNSVVKGFSGFQIADQIFPEGYQLHISHFNSKTKAIDLPKEFKERPLEILISPARVSKSLRDNIKKAITDTVGIEPKFISVPLSDILVHFKKQDYDFYAGTVGLADPDPEGVMSYYFENELRVIPSFGDENFIKRLDNARKETIFEKRVELMRKMLNDAVSKGYVLPLFNMSTIGIARKELDLSQVPLTDESVTLSKVRFK